MLYLEDPLNRFIYLHLHLESVDPPRFLHAKRASKWLNHYGSPLSKEMIIMPPDDWIVSNEYTQFVWYKKDGQLDVYFQKQFIIYDLQLDKKYRFYREVDYLNSNLADIIYSFNYLEKRK